MQVSSATVEEDFSGLSLPDRLVHKNWKARISGYEELFGKWKHIVEPSDPDFKKFAEYIKVLAVDSNAAALDSAYNVIKLFVETSDLAVKCRKELTPLIIEKGLMAPRTSTKSKAIDLLLEYAYIDTADSILDELINFFIHKQPKQIVAVVNFTSELLRVYGVPTVNIKRLCKEFPKLFLHADNFVRQEATNLAIEIYRWTGKGRLSFIDDLKPAQQKELYDLFEKLPNVKPVPQRNLRSASPKENNLPNMSSVKIIASGEESAVSVLESNPVVDTWDLVEPVEILSKIPETFSDQISSQDWKERKQALDTLLSLSKVPRLSSDGKYVEIIQLLAKKLHDTNINIVIVSANCIEALALGLRAAFIPYQNLVLDNLLERCKEKKANVSEALRGALDALFDTSGVLLNEHFEAFTAALSHKNPQVKAEAIGWIFRSLQKSKKAPSKAEFGTLCDGLIKRALDDSTVDVREASISCFAAIVKIVGEKAAGIYLDQIVDKIKLAKILDMRESIHVALKPAASSSNPISNNNMKAPNLQVKAASTIPRSKPIVKSSASSISPAITDNLREKSAPINSSNVGIKEEPVIFKWTAESAISNISDILGESLVASLGDANWKTRLSGAEKLLALVCDARWRTACDAESLTRFLLWRPSLKDSNFQVLQKLVECLSIIFACSEYSITDTRTAMTCLLGSCNGLVIEKITDLKLKNSVVDLLISVAEKKFGLPATLNLLLQSLNDITSGDTIGLKIRKNFKQFAEVCKLVHCLIKEFAVSVNLPLKQILVFLRDALSSPNALVRSEAISCLLCLRNVVGSDVEIRKYLEIGNLNPSLLSTLSAEFAKNPLVVVAPVRSFLLGAKTSMTVSVANASEPGSSSSAPLNDAALSVSIPLNHTQVLDCNQSRVDIRSFLPALLEQLASANWKIRKEGLDGLMTKFNQRVMITCVTDELLAALKSRLSDSNKNLITLSMDVITCIVSSVRGTPDGLGRSLKSAHYGSALICALMLGLADIKQQIRAAAIRSLDGLFACDAHIRISSHLPVFLFEQAISILASSDSPILRKELCSWMCSSLNILVGEQISGKVPALKEILRSKEFLLEIARCLSDKTLEVRKAAQLLVARLLHESGTSSVISFDWQMPQTYIKEIFREIGKGDLVPILDQAATCQSAIVNIPATMLSPSGIDRSSTKEDISTVVDKADILIKPISYKLDLDGIGLTDCHLSSKEISSPCVLIPPIELPSSLISTRLDTALQRILVDDPIVVSSGLTEIEIIFAEQNDPSKVSSNSIEDIRPFISRIVDSLIGKLETCIFVELQSNSIAQSSNNIPRSVKHTYLSTKSMESNNLPASSNISSARRVEIFAILERLVALLLSVFIDTHRDPSPGSHRRGDSGFAFAVDKKSISFCLRIVIGALSLPSFFWNMSVNSTIASPPQNNGQGAAFVRQLNVLLLKLLENSHRDLLYGCLLGKLESVCVHLIDADINEEPIINALSNDCISPSFIMASSHDYIVPLNEADYTFIELLMKCIWRLTRSIQENISASQLNIVDLIRSCNAFLLSASPYQWKKRVAQNKRLADMPLRTIKTILHELCIALPESAQNDFLLDALGVDWEKSMVAGYLRFMLEKRREAETSNENKQSSVAELLNSPEGDSNESISVRLPEPIPLSAISQNAAPDDYRARLSQFKTLFDRGSASTVHPSSIESTLPINTALLQPPPVNNPLSKFDSSLISNIHLDVEKENSLVDNTPASSLPPIPNNQYTPSASVSALKDRLAKLKAAESKFTSSLSVSSINPTQE